MAYQMENVDVKETNIYRISKELLETLLKDQTTKKNIIWATDNYQDLGPGYEFNSEIEVRQIIDHFGEIIKPRTLKSKENQALRVREKAEVFTPAWICNKQNNLIDSNWFNNKNVFNSENGRSWRTNQKKIVFPNGKKWMDYVTRTDIEVACGEAPYLVSRYDATSGKAIILSKRIGLLDRKLRVINENTSSEKEWLRWVYIAYESTYGFEWQGDNLLLARENLLYTFIDNYLDSFKNHPPINKLQRIAEIISFNIFQMDGLKFVIPGTCKNKLIKVSPTLFDFDDELSSLYSEKDQVIECLGCKNHDNKKHNGIYSSIKDWKTHSEKRFIDIVEENQNDRNQNNI